MDIILYNILTAILVTIIGYVFGSIPNGILVGKLFFHKDPRDYGSGNSGGTNVGRTFGKKFGVLVIFLDAVKVILPIYLVWLFLIKVPLYNNLPLMPTVDVKYLGGDISDYLIKWPVYWLVVVGASLGHCYPVLNHFKGGKNVAVYAGSALGTTWAISIIPAIIFFLVLKIKKMVSLASNICAWCGVLLAWIWAILIMTGAINGSAVWFVNYGCSLECNYVFAIVLTFAAIILTLKHRANFQRIKEGTESKIKWMK